MKGTVTQFDELTHRLDTFVEAEQRRCRQLKKAVITFAPMLDGKDTKAVLATVGGKKVKWQPKRCASRLHQLSVQKQHLNEQEKTLQTHIANMREYLKELRARYEEEAAIREEAEHQAADMMGEMERIRQLLYEDSDGSTTDSSSPHESPVPTTRSKLTRNSALRQSLLKVFESPTGRRVSGRPPKYSPSPAQLAVERSPAKSMKTPSPAKRTSPNPRPAHISPSMDKENAPQHMLGEAHSPKRANTSPSPTRPAPAAEQVQTQHSNVQQLKQRFEHTRHSPQPHGSLAPQAPTSPPRRSYAPSPLRVMQSPGNTPTTPKHKQHWKPTVFAQCTQTSPARPSAPPSPTRGSPSPIKSPPPKMALSPGEDRYNPTNTSSRVASAPMSPTYQSPMPSARRALPHFFHTHTAFLRQACQQCHGTILYLNKYRKCSTCGFICHAECEESCPLDCGVLPTNRAHRQSLDLLTATGPGYDIPKLLTSCFQCIEERWLHAQGLYRHAGSSYEHKGVDLIHRFLRGRSEPNLRCINDPHEITTCVKLFLSDLGEPLLTSRRHDNFVHAIVHNSGDKKLDAITAVVETLPRVNFFTLKCIIDHLNKVTAHASYNNATRDVLVVEMTPCLMRLRHNKGNQAMKPEEEVVDTLLALKQSHWRRAEKTVLECHARNPGERAPVSSHSSVKSSSSSGSSVRSPFRSWFSRR
ncbi:hypothetical protein PTSG_01630 [Salpingoeca rosetta]|uniref:Rho-GAP domain-containing protein n=1 Tax=Salpingoeca rosetta (strain ATCC 50818 / BSB-021) TaxID=946362 RepID=F2TYH8_SALR5|nr:uncharacterized protein PTSG_01630 [Salpingoeca rosetta]EGD78652.1 hypothetical protein PTSG_01630 [Salpingoeca rosetta]|eukprot:XP_004997610.1 hypothetical protein PTSG_01630 [Salpingoeca rosetta]